MRRFLAGLEAAYPHVATMLEFDSGEAAQVDFGKGPEVLNGSPAGRNPFTGQDGNVRNRRVSVS